MVESIATTYLLGQRPACGGSLAKDICCKRKSTMMTRRFPASQYTGTAARLMAYLSTPGVRIAGFSGLSIEALAMEQLAKEAYGYREERILKNFNHKKFDTGVGRNNGLWPPENKADKPALHNPLLRQERMGCGWFGAIFEWEGVLIEDNPEIERQSWLALSEEEGESPPPAFLLRRIEGMKSEQAITEVLCWSRDPVEVKRMATRREELHQDLQGWVYSLRPGSMEFMNILMQYQIPMALVSTRPRKTVETAIVTIGIEGFFSVIVAAEDVYRGKPDPEMFVYAAQLLSFIPERCIVFGNSNQTVEAAHDARMKCVAVASKHPIYELAAAEVVVRWLDELSVVDLKNLADIESTEFDGELELETEDDEDDDDWDQSTSTVGDDDFF